MKNLRIYIAGPISVLSYEQAIEYFNYFGNRLKGLGYTVFNPMADKEYFRDDEVIASIGYTKPVITNHAIFERDQWMVRNVDVIVCNLLEADTRVSIGSMMELAWGAMLGKHIVLIMGKENIHKHAFVLEAADIVFETVEETLKYLEGLNQ